MNETQERKKIIILGGTGYVGRLLHEKLIKTFDVQSLGIDAFNKYKFEDAHVLINLAAHSSVALCELFPKTAEYNNVSRLKKIIENLPNETHLIHASSASVYGRGNDQSNEEDALPIPQNLYDNTKILGDRIILEAVETGKKITSLRFGTVCGLSPLTRTDLVLNSMVKSAISTGQIHTFGSETRRSILLIDDLTEAITRICTLKPVGVFNLGSLNTTVGEIGRAVQEHSGAILKENKIKSQSPYDFHLNCNKIESIIGNFHISSLEETIKKLQKGLGDVEESQANVQGPHPMLSLQFN
jgi:nucleoside-diphosphate-sugar epimerase